MIKTQITEKNQENYKTLMKKLLGKLDANHEMIIVIPSKKCLKI